MGVEPTLDPVIDQEPLNHLQGNIMKLANPYPLPKLGSGCSNTTKNEEKTYVIGGFWVFMGWFIE